MKTIVANTDILQATGAALAALRKVKSEQKVSQKTPYENVTIAANENDIHN